MSIRSTEYKQTDESTQFVELDPLFFPEDTKELSLQTSQRMLDLIKIENNIDQVIDFSLNFP